MKTIVDYALVIVAYWLLFLGVFVLAMSIESGSFTLCGIAVGDVVVGFWLITHDLDRWTSERGRS